AAADAGPLTLREAARPGAVSRVEVRLTAQGLYKPETPPEAADEAAKAKEAEARSKGLSLKVETRLEFLERVVRADDAGRPTVTLRRATRAGAAINGEVRPSASALRPEVATLLAEVRPSGIEVASLGGPLTRSELELVEAPGDPLALAGLLPANPVEPRARWTVSDLSARSLSGYDVLEANRLEATLADVDDDTATIRLGGEVRGKALGGEGTMAFSGACVFDRKANRVKSLKLDRAETRRPGPVEAGLDVKSALSVTREDAEPSPSLTDEGVARLDLDGELSDDARRVARRALLLRGPDGRFTLRHDRDWHTYWDDHRLTILKRLDARGGLVAQCNLAAGPRAGKGRHQDLNQFRDDVRRGLGGRFSGFLGAGEVDGDPAGHFRYKIGAQGKQGDLGVVWYYYLIASPEGEQLVATFTLAATALPAFGAEDERLVGGFRWEPRTEGTAAVEDGRK
ncbi:MAG: hypothetical protein K2X91_12450, partial [Thermoleophilia bacterium]|nr:hypothetical protein [Thermoleophilia bacterium]